MAKLALRCVVASLVVSQAAGEAVELTGKSFAKKVFHPKRSALVKFLAPWCGHCKKMKPDWDELGDKYDGSKKVLIGDVDCTVEGNKALCEEQGVKGYPTIKYYTPGDTDGTNYEGERDLKSLKAFVKTLGPACSRASLKSCKGADKEKLEAYMALPEAELASKLEEAKASVADAQARHDELLKQLQSQFKKSEEELKALKDATEPEIKLMKGAMMPADPPPAA